MNPDMADTSGEVYADALRAFLLAVIADTFELRASEMFWADHHLRDLTAPLAAQQPHVVPLAVSHELATGRLRAQLQAMEAAGEDPAYRVRPAGVRYADAEQWAAVFMQMITASYELRPMAEAGMRGQMIGMLRELGVGHASQPRASRYLPDDLLEMLRLRREEEALRG